MSAPAALAVAQALLGMHVAAAAFILTGIITVPLGVHYHWAIIP